MLLHREPVAYLAYISISMIDEQSPGYILIILNTRLDVDIRQKMISGISFDHIWLEVYFVW